MSHHDFVDDTVVVRSRDDAPGSDGEVDDPDWRLLHLYKEMGKNEQERVYPNVPTLLRLVGDYRDSWLDAGGRYRTDNLMSYVVSRLANSRMFFDRYLTPQGLDHDTFEDFMGRHDAFYWFFWNLTKELGVREEYMVRAKFQAVRRTIHTIRAYFQAVGRLYVVMRSTDSHLEGAEMVPSEDRDIDSFNKEVETYMECDPSKNDNFQNAFLALRGILEGCGYRRAEDRFFRRVKTATELATNAFVFAVTIRDFVSRYTSHVHDIKLWRWATRPVSNLRQLEDYLTQRDLPEAPFLSENHHLRSFAGDKMGRGAVVYCSDSDFAFEYRLRSSWVEMAEWVTSLRRRLWNDPRYVCKPPDPADVCIAHLECAFPHDIHEELQGLACLESEHLVPFRECDTWELDTRRVAVAYPVAAGRLDGSIGPRVKSLGRTVGERWRLVLGTDVVDQLKPSDAIDLGPTDMTTLRQRCIEAIHADTFELGRSPSVVVAEGAHVSLPSDGHMWRLSEGGVVRPPHGQVTDPAFLAVFQTRVAEQGAGEAFVRLHTRDLDVLRGRITDESMVRLSDTEMYVPCPIHLVPLVNHHMQPRANLTWVGGEWQRVATARDEDVLVTDAQIVRSLDEDARVAAERDPDWERIRRPAFDVADNAVVRLTDGTLLRQVGVLPRSFDVHSHYLTHGGRCFVVDTGRECFDCNTEEIDHIYRCQKFCDHDVFYLYGLKGRLLFRVGEKDRHQLTLFLEGYGGCGKSTIMNAQMGFHPPHKRGVLSSNIEPLFGMSQVMKNGESEVIFCNEVATDLALKQEEWQISTGGEFGSYAVKNGKPCVIKCKAQHMWVGNSKPGFKNDQNQMGRRLGAVLMPYPVRPRDGGIPDVLDRKMGHLLRREVVSYRQFVRATGTCDPMSVPEKLPPAFRDYHERLRRETDPVQDFVKDGSFVERCEADQGFITMERFRELYEAFRVKHNMGKSVRWTEAVYRPAFNEHGIHLKCVKSIWVEGQEKVNIMVAYGLREVVRMAL